jgi:hypothetical protein
MSDFSENPVINESIIQYYPVDNSNPKTVNAQIQIN